MKREGNYFGPSGVCYKTDVRKAYDFCEYYRPDFETQVECYANCDPSRDLSTLSAECADDARYFVQCYRPVCASYTRSTDWNDDPNLYLKSTAAWVAQFCNPIDSREHLSRLSNLRHGESVKVCCDYVGVSMDKLAPKIAIPVIVVLVVVIIASGVIWYCLKMNICKIRPRGGR